MDEPLWVGLLGPFEVRVAGVPCGPGGARRRGVLAILAAEPNVAHTVPSIIDGLWGEDPPDSAVNLVQSYISAWRKALAGAKAALKTVGNGYQVVLPAEQSDLLTFRKLIARARGQTGAAAADPARAALDLWRGPALADMAGQPFHTGIAERLEAERAAATELWAEAALTAGYDADLILPELEGLLRRDPLRESAAALMMWAHAQASRPSLALTVFDKMRHRLDEDLGTLPGPRLQDMHQLILRADHSLGRRNPVRADRSGPLAASRPDFTPADRFFGREHELADLARLLVEERLVTMTGPGGSGKTRLALEILKRTLASGQPGYFVELAPVHESSLAPAAVATALGLAAAAGTDPADMLVERLVNSSALLILDNAEHLPGLTSFIRRLYRACPDLHLLITSRQPMRIEGERQYTVRVLPTPTTSDVDEVLSHGSVQLLIDRVRSHEPSFRVTADNAEEMAAIVRLLDGLPLAIEIIAPWLRLYGPAGLLKRLGSGQLDLRGRRGDVDARHRSLREAITWSNDLIAAPERLAFQRLAVFAATFGLDAANAVCSDDGCAVEELVFDLVDRNLIQTSSPIAGQPRFTMLAAVREFALELLAKDPQSEAVHQRMLDWYVGWAAELARHSEGPDAPTWQALAVAEADNLRAAIDHCSKVGRDVDLLQLVVDAMPLWFEAGQEHEGEERLRDALDRAGPDAPSRAVALTYWAWLRATRDKPGAAAAAREALGLAVATGDVPIEAFALQTLGDSLSGPEEAEQASRSALEACDRAAGHEVRYGPTAPDAVRCGASASIATCWTYRSLPVARQWQTEALQRAELEGDQRITAVNCARLARLHLLAGDVEAASTLLDRAHSLMTFRFSARWEDTVALADAELARHEGRDMDAERLLRSIAAGAAAAGRVLHAVLGAVALADLYLDTGRASDATAAIDRTAALITQSDATHRARIDVRRARIDRESGRPEVARSRLDALSRHVQRMDGMPPERTLWLLEKAVLEASTHQPDHAIALLEQLEAGLKASGLALPPWERVRADLVARQA